ncbi:MAG: hypothetical protein KC777_15630 [Cyanobacteria bacterium HKST-UBA02]|nr:hypothetical protein [Cyanobacteria bacterium HKST-UBA02]
MKSQANKNEAKRKQLSDLAQAKELKSKILHRAKGGLVVNQALWYGAYVKAKTR